MAKPQQKTSRTVWCDTMAVERHLNSPGSGISWESSSICVHSPELAFTPTFSAPWFIARHTMVSGMRKESKCPWRLWSEAFFRTIITNF